MNRYNKSQLLTIAQWKCADKSSRFSSDPESKHEIIKYTFRSIHLTDLLSELLLESFELNVIENRINMR